MECRTGRRWSLACSLRKGSSARTYAGDEDKTLSEIASIIDQEIAPKLIGQNAFAVERCWSLPTRSPTISSATGEWAGRARKC